MCLESWTSGCLVVPDFNPKTNFEGQKIVQNVVTVKFVARLGSYHDGTRPLLCGAFIRPNSVAKLDETWQMGPFLLWDGAGRL